MSLLRRTLIGSSLAAVAAPAINSARAAGNVLRIGIGSSLNTLEPMMTTIGDEYIYDNLAFNGLTCMTEELSVKPDLAESWMPSADLKEWTFKLRKGVIFHDGSELVAEDVVAFFKRMLDPASSAPTRSQYDMIDGIAAPDATTVVFKLNIPYGGFAGILTDRQAKITPRGAAAQMATKPIGTGPFKVVSYTPGDRLVLAAHADYFEGAPKLAGVELRIIPEMSVKIAALQAGDIDIVWDLPLDQVKVLSPNAALRVDSVPTSSWDAAIMNNAIPPFNDKRVRQAFHLAVDKKDVVELTLFGQGVETISPIAPSHPFYAKDVVIPKPDPVAAKKLLAAAGFTGGVKVPIIVPVGRPVRERLGVTLQQLAKAGGFDLQVQRVPYSSFNAEVSGKAPLYIDGFFSRPTIDTSLFAFLRSKGSWNERLWHYSNEAVDKALDAARLSADPAVQKKNYVDMQAALVADPASFFAYNMNYACAYRKAVGNVKTHPMRWFDLRTATVA
ncbi:MAG: ABC transporter substrate-binding protein [Alphaproteobacteria bacterium]|nr:ABC transporter substrate-binding protein [Alphaproteobacteria bacterium]